MWEGLKSGSLHSLNYKIYYFKQSPRVQILSSMSVGTNLVLKRRFWCLHKLSITKNCRVSKRQFRFNWKNIYLVLKCWNALLSTGHRVGAVTLLSSQSFLVLLYSPLTDALNQPASQLPIWGISRNVDTREAQERRFLGPLWLHCSLAHSREENLLTGQTSIYCDSEEK